MRAIVRPSASLAELRQKQSEAIVARYASAKGSVLLVGDMNEGPDGNAIQTFEVAGFRRSCSSPRQQCSTFPGPTYFLPAVLEIDHILGRNVEFEEARVIREGGSDHFPVFAKLRLSKRRTE